jgi:hypothetical protein
LTVASLMTSCVAISVLEAAGDELEHLELARGQFLQAGGVGVGHGGAAEEARDQPARDRRGEQGVACCHCADGGDELLGGRGFEQEAAGAGLQRVVDVAVEVEGCEDEHAGGARRGIGEHAPSGFELVEPRHADVHPPSCPVVE